MDEFNELNGLIERSGTLSWARLGRAVNFCHTSAFFPAITVTGASCALNCKHCEGILIRRLPAATTPSELKRKCLAFYRNGAKGVLITGGCNRDGAVPINEFLQAVREIKASTGMLIVAHSGLVGDDEAREVKDAGVDGVCLDVVGCEETTEEVYNLRITASDYEKTLKAFDKAGMKNISPHVCVGLHYGEIRHELVGKGLDDNNAESVALAKQLKASLYTRNADAKAAAEEAGLKVYDHV